MEVMGCSIGPVVAAEPDAAATCPSLEELYRRDAEYFGRVAYLLTNNAERAEDLVQEAFARMAGRIDGIRDPGALRAYLRRTVVNLAIKDSRRRGSERAYLRKWAPAEPRAADLPDIATRHHLIAELRSLPARQRAVVVLRYYEDMPEREIAATLGWPVGSVKSSLSRALTALRISLEEGPTDG